MPRPATVAIDIGALIGHPVTGAQRVIHDLVPRLAEKLFADGMSIVLAHSRFGRALTPLQTYDAHNDSARLREALLTISRESNATWLRLLKRAMLRQAWARPLLRHDSIARAAVAQLQRLLQRRRTAPSQPALQADAYLHASFGLAPWHLPSGVASHRVCFLLHDVIPLTHPDLVPPAMTEAFRESVAQLNAVKHFAPGQATFITATRHAAEEIGRVLWRLARLTPRLELVSWGYGRDRFYPEPAPDFRARLRLSPTKKLVLAVSTHEPRKRFAAIEHSVRRLAETHPVQGIFVGPSPYGYPRSDETIRYLGYLDDALLRQAYSNCNVFVNWSLCEGFGLPVIEALACGAPTIIPPDSPALLEIGTHHVHVAVTACEDDLRLALRRVLFDPLPQQPLPDLSRFDWDRVAATFARILQAPALKVSA